MPIKNFEPKGGKSNPVFWANRIKGDLALMPYLNRPEMFVSTLKEFDVTPEMKVKLGQAGVDPYAEIGLAPKLKQHKKR